MNKEQLNILGCLDVIEFLISKHSDEQALSILAMALVTKIHGLPEDERQSQIQLFWETFRANLRRVEQAKREEQ